MHHVSSEEQHGGHDTLGPGRNSRNEPEPKVRLRARLWEHDTPCFSKLHGGSEDSRSKVEVERQTRTRGEVESDTSGLEYSS